MVLVRFGIARKTGIALGHGGGGIGTTVSAIASAGAACSDEAVRRTDTCGPGAAARPARYSACWQRRAAGSTEIIDAGRPRTAGKGIAAAICPVGGCGAGTKASCHALFDDAIGPEPDRRDRHTIGSSAAGLFFGKEIAAAGAADVVAKRSRRTAGSEG